MKKLLTAIGLGLLLGILVGCGAPAGYDQAMTNCLATLGSDDPNRDMEQVQAMCNYLADEDVDSFIGAFEETP